MPRGPSTTSAGSVTARTYMNAHSGMRLSVAIAQNGILRRCLAACTYTGSGFGGGGAAGAGAGVRAGGPDAAGAGVAGVVVAGVVAGEVEAAASPAGASVASSPWPIAERRSRDRFRRCSGISVTSEMIDARDRDPGICPGIGSDALTHNLARSRDLRARLRTSRDDDYSSLFSRRHHHDRILRTHDRNRPTRVARDEPGLPDGSRRDPRAVARDHPVRQAPPGR